MAAVSSAADGRHTDCSTAVVSVVDDRRTMNVSVMFKNHYDTIY